MHPASALTAEDLATRKVPAILDRTEGRDFTDLWALGGDLGGGSGGAQQLDSGVSEHDGRAGAGRCGRAAEGGRWGARGGVVSRAWWSGGLLGGPRGVLGGS